MNKNLFTIIALNEKDHLFSIRRQEGALSDLIKSFNNGESISYKYSS